ncbi:hypothetical protein PG985_007968 [Apiospora marii]|uniref:uncharacterized protein n=1 Tax=Apiospora marii TaxID=335849 RepID=UPI00312FE1BD
MGRSSSSFHLWNLVLLIIASPISAWPVFPLLPRASAEEPGPFAHTKNDVIDLRNQILNPQGILAVLLLVGSDVVQKAIAQSIGGCDSSWSRFTPVAFSFGWVSYAANSVVAALGDGIFLPKADTSGFVITLNSGDSRSNQSWLLGRLMRDLEMRVERDKNNKDKLNSGLLVTVYKVKKDGMLNPDRRKLWVLWAVVMLVQGFVAAIPVLLTSADRNAKVKGTESWYVFAITLIGNGLAMATAAITSMHRPKFSMRDDKSTEMYALTRGNGHRHVFIIMPDTLIKESSSLPHLEDMSTNLAMADNTTRALATIAAIAWVFLLLSVAGLQGDTGYLLLVGLVGMIHNLFVSSKTCTAEEHGLPMEELTIGEQKAHEFGRGTKLGKRIKAMKVLKELENEIPSAGCSLRPIFFPGRPRDKDEEYWNEKKHDILTRLGEKESRWYEESRRRTKPSITLSNHHLVNAQPNTVQPPTALAAATSDAPVPPGPTCAGAGAGGSGVATTVPKEMSNAQLTPHSIIQDAEIDTIKGKQAFERNEGLEKAAGLCGFSAVIASMRAQFPHETAPTMAQLLEVLNSDSEEAKGIKMVLSWVNDSHDNKSWFLQDHLAALFKMWAGSVGIDMILGILDTRTGHSRRHESGSTTEDTKVLWVAYEPGHYRGISLR